MTTGLIRTETVRFEGGFRGSWHDHSEAQLIYPARGVMVLQTSSGVWVASALQACWLPAGETHRVEAPRGFQMISVYCRGHWLRRLPDRAGIIPVSPLLRETIAEIRPSVSPARLRRLAGVFADEVRLHGRPVLNIPPVTGRLLPMIESALLRDPGDARTLQDWADELRVSTKTLSRAFVTQTGASFTSYRRQVRLHSALIRLAEGETATRVGLSLGFGSASSFIRTFREATSVTPGRVFRSRSRRPN